MTEASDPNTDPKRPSFRARAGLLLVLLAATALVAHASTRTPEPPAGGGSVPTQPPPRVDVVPADAARVEVAFVLDTTGSMSGLIEGAKRKIWSIANQLASADQKTSVRVALIGYRDRGDAYVTRRFDLTEDVDGIYAALRQQSAQGGGDGPESVNQALHEAVTTLAWSPDPSVYKVIFLVGDAPPHMDYPDDVPFEQSVRLARQRGIAVNTVQCGTLQETAAVWQRIAELGAGQYAAIAQDGGMVAVATPMDDELAHLATELADTAIAYGSVAQRRELRSKLDLAAAAPASAAADRAAYLSKVGGRVVSGASDLLDAVKDGLSLDEVAEEELPPELQAMEPPARKGFVEEKLKRRQAIQERIDELASERDAWLADENARLAAEGGGDGFDQKVFETIREQAAAKGIAY